MQHRCHHDQFQLFSTHLALAGALLDSVAEWGPLPFHGFYIRPNVTRQISHSAQEQVRDLRSSGQLRRTGGLSFPGGTRVLAESSPSQGHHTAKAFPSRRHGSAPPAIPRSGAAQVRLLLTIFHQRSLSCVLTSFLKATGGIQAEGLVQGDPLRSPPPLKPEALS